MREMTREEMLPIMYESGAMGELDINDEDFLGGHGREDSHVAAMQAAYAAGFRAAQSDEAAR